MRKYLLFSLQLFFLWIAVGCKTNYTTLDTDKRQNSMAADANIKLAIAFLKEGAVRYAKEKLLMAEKLDSNNPAVWYSFGYFYETTGNLEQARESYLTAIKMAPKDGAAHNNYGIFLCHHGQYKQSVNEFLMAVQDRQYLESAGAYENAGLCCLKIPDKKRAKNFFLNALAQDPRFTSSCYYLAELAYEEKNYSDSKKFLSHPFLALNPSKKTQQLANKVAEKLHDKSLLNLYKHN